MMNQILNNRYKIQHKLGRQTGRITFLAEDLETQQKVVIKLLLLGEDFDWQDLKLFEREAETLKTLNHHNIPRYLNYFELDNDDEKGFALVQTYVEGKTLEQHLKSGRTFNETEVKELAISLLEILSYLHQHEPPVIHRDIKPSNILLTNRSGNSPGQVYLVDFGSVQTVAATNGGTITVVGTYGYMPPEQFGGRCVEASDLYSLGATLIFLITGLHPTELPQKDLQIQFRQTANFSEEFANWLEWMTEPSLSQRYKSTEEAIKALDNPLPRQKTLSFSKPNLEKPRGSEIKLYKDISGLEIVIPPQGFRLPQIALISLISPFAIGFDLSNLSRQIHSQQISDTASLMKYTVQVFGIVFILFIILWALFRRTRLKISESSVSCTYELIRIKWKFKQQKLIKNKYQLGITHPSPEELCRKYSHLSLEEMEWLAQEISDYLNIPIERM
ncbi:serine/threonine kinase [Calothrix parasitica NIES-267]|uniref:Serine/threonine kinase n=1 Tax=Calothrix parasitica NIES-267 TaxID=1973488 RepID=A0A1Z4LW28_9CYAN|nr:serine/threonine kinase [Calothrix parasitica NIES-267]